MITSLLIFLDICLYFDTFSDRILDFASGTALSRPETFDESIRWPCVQVAPLQKVIGPCDDGVFHLADNP